MDAWSGRSRRRVLVPVVKVCLIFVNTETKIEAGI